MKKRFLIIISAIVVMVTPIVAFAADEPQTQPQVEVLTLDQCLQIAYENSKQLKSADESVTIAKANLTQAESNLFPTLSYSIAELKYGIDYPLTGYGTTEGSYGYLFATQNLYTGGVTTGTIKVAKLSLTKALEEQRKAKQTLTYDVKSAYYQAWLSVQLLKVAQASYDNLGQHEQQMRVFYKAGTKSRYDLLQAQVNHEGQKPAWITAQNNLILANMKLATTIGVEEDRQITASDDPSKVTIPQSLEFEFQKLVEQAYHDRPEMRELKLADEINTIQTQMAYAGYKPRVSLTASMGGVGSTALDYKTKLGTDWTSDMTKDWVLLLNVTGNFFDGFKTPSAVTQGKATIKKAELDESYTRDTMRLDVRQALQTIHGDLETIAASKAQIDLAKENLWMTQSRFHDGLSTNMDVLDAEFALDQASNSYYSGVSAYLTALAKLDYVMGKD
jgi:outer membrane protein